MAIKRYITSGSSEFTQYLTLPNGKELKVRFAGKDVHTKERFVDVDDVVVQEALESQKAFGVYFRLSKETIVEAYTLPVDSRLEKEFATVRDAKDYLHLNHGIAYSELPNRIKVVEVFSGLGLSIKFKND